MSVIRADYSQYLHTYETYRLSSDSISKTVSGASLVKNDTDSTELILTEESKEQMIADRNAYFDMLKCQLDAYYAKQNAEADAKMNEDKAKALTVFRELSAGKNVPSYDENKLMEYDSKLYNMAKMAQMMAQLEQERKQEKTEDSLWNDEDREKAAVADDQEPFDLVQEMGEHRQAQADCVVEVSADGIDASSITSFASMGSGVYQAIFDTTI